MNKFLWIPLIALCAPVVAGAEDALITFSGLNNGVSTCSASSSTQGDIPQTYQPLLNKYPLSAKNNAGADGANLGVSITWGGVANFSNPVANKGVSDHTKDAGRGGEGLGGVVMFGGPAGYWMAFDHPVQIPSFFWTYYGGTEDRFNGKVTAYIQGEDSNKPRVIALMYSESAGYIWKEEKGLAGLPVIKLVFESGQNNLNIDDISVRPVEKK